MASSEPALVCILVAVAASAAAVPTPNFPVSWVSTETNAIAIAQGTVNGPNGEICCAKSSPKCQAQTQSQQGTHYYDGVGNQTRFDSSGQTIITKWGSINREMLVAPNGTCLQYCPVQGPFDPSPFWPDEGDHELIKDLGKETINGVECHHYQWIEHILGVIKVQETNIYLKLPTEAGEMATPVFEHDILEPFGNPVGFEDTTWSDFKKLQPDPSLFKVTGIAECPESPNCGNDNDLRRMRRLRDKDFRTFARYRNVSTISRQTFDSEGADVKTLRCEVDKGIAHVQMTLSYFSNKYFSVKDAQILDNYHAGNLICIGSTLTDGQEIHCVGYDNGSANSLYEVTIAPMKGSPTEYGASYEFIRPAGPPQTPGPWPCTLI